MKISIVGAGPGRKELLSGDAINAIREADILIGAERLTKPYSGEKTVFTLYKPEEIVEKIRYTGIGNNVVILRSGDPGFFSSAGKIFKLIDTDSAFKGAEVNVIPGISSMQYFLLNLHMSWENVKYISLHGRKGNIVGYIKRYQKVFTLLSSGKDLEETCEKLKYYGITGVKLIIGTKLSYPGEDVIVSDPVSFLSEYAGKTEKFALSVALFINNDAEDDSFYPIDDEEFIRGEVPMTKEEIRTISLSKLRLKSDSVLFDIGGGTGSISVSAAKRLIDGEVYAIEKNSEAVELIKKNKQKFAADNINIVNDSAPACFDKLPKPTHFFIGGSGDDLKGMVESCIRKNPEGIIVLNVISLDTLTAINTLIREKEMKADITLINAARSKEAGAHRLMIGGNPVYIIKIN